MKQDADGFIDPKSLTADELYKLQSDTWGQGYDVGNAGLVQAIQTAEQIATMRERKRILNIIDNAINQYTKTSVFSYRNAINELLKEINE